MNFCRDCKFNLLYTFYLPSDFCTRTDGEPVRNVVTGDFIYPTCESERSNADRCGRDGRYFEAREERKD